VAFVALLVIVIIVLVVRDRRSRQRNAEHSRSDLVAASRPVASFTNPNYAALQTKRVEQESAYNNETSATYDEPAFMSSASKQNPVYEDAELYEFSRFLGLVFVYYCFHYSGREPGEGPANSDEGYLQVNND
jgi:hypothetical protein